MKKIIPGLINKMSKYLFICLLVVAIDFLNKKNFFYSKDLDTTCTTQFIIKNEFIPGTEMNGYIRYIFGKRTILARLEGSIIDGDYQSSVSRLIYFEYSRKGNSLNLITKRIVISNADNTPQDKIDKLLPLYYLQSGINSNIYFYPESNGNMMLLTGIFPSFYCLKNR